MRSAILIATVLGLPFVAHAKLPEVQPLDEIVLSANQDGTYTSAPWSANWCMGERWKVAFVLPHAEKRAGKLPKGLYMCDGDYTALNSVTTIEITEIGECEATTEDQIQVDCER